MTPEPLDNPVWHSLTGELAAFATGTGDARRFRREVTQLGAVRGASLGAYESLASQTEVGEALYVGGVDLDPLPACWAVEVEKPMLQLVLQQPAEAPAPAVRPEVLGELDRAAMCGLVDLTHPGPFGPQCHRLGLYVGVRDAGQLVAMAGERMRLSGFTEISAVCTHPQWQGRGLARALMNYVAAHIQGRGETPFLHVIEENSRAVELYMRMGFTLRRRLWARVIRRVV